jgi:hypothetical protein
MQPFQRAQVRQQSSQRCGSAEEWRKQEIDANLMTEAQQASETSCLFNQNETTQNVSFVLIDRDTERRVMLRRERTEVVRPKSTCLFIIAGTLGRQDSALRWVPGGGGGRWRGVALGCLPLLWSRVLAAGLSGSAVHELGPLCVWK